MVDGKREEAAPGVGNELIFVSIASYRDSQLVPTVEDLLRKADEPCLLRFGICWQHSMVDAPLPFAGDERFRIIDVDWRDSRGACWARAEIMKLSRGEQWFLQIDSHCRFAQGWDTKLIRMMAQTGSRKPILSTYAYPFTPGDIANEQEEELTGVPLLMAVETFSDDGIPQLKPLTIPEAVQHDRPMAARFLAAGFLFAPGSFVEEVPYDPELYFFGEEISMSLRAFTSGYDLFHPVEQVVWHDYVRTYAVRHWDDHASESNVARSANLPSWGDRDQVSRKKILQMLHTPASRDPLRPAAPPSGRFGLGTVRSLLDYEQYAGISMQHRKIQDYTRYALEPPNPAHPAEWPKDILTWLVRVVVDRAALSPEAFTDSGFWMVAIQDGDRREIRRRDFSWQELTSLRGDSPQIVLLCEIQSGIIPAFWSVWPFSRPRGWLNRVDGTLGRDDFSIVED